MSLKTKIADLLDDTGYALEGLLRVIGTTFVGLAVLSVMVVLLAMLLGAVSLVAAGEGGKVLLGLGVVAVSYVIGRTVC